MSINRDLDTILKNSHTVAIIGLSDSPAKASYQVAKYLQTAGYKIYPVNPKYDTILGSRCYASLQDIGVPIDIVNIFRRPEHVLPIVEDAAEIGAQVVWMQLGIINMEAAILAEKAGLKVIMDRCMKIEHQHLSR